MDVIFGLNMEHTTTFRVRYAETDRMGYLYYGNYATYFEVGRVELLRSLGVSYRDLEDSGVLLPVREFGVRYYKPAYYDELLRLSTSITDIGRASIRFEYRLYNTESVLLTTAFAVLVCVSRDTGRPITPPEPLRSALNISA